METKLDFLDVLASTLHDTKNSLGILYNTLEDVIEECKNQNCPTNQRFYILQYEIKRLNSSLIRLLSLYKAERSQFTVNPEFYSVCEFLEDTAMQHAPLLLTKGIEIEAQCSDDLFWTFDRGLVSGVLDNVLNNAYNYTRDRVLISADKKEECLLIKVEDNGIGYPDWMITETQAGVVQDGTVDFSTGSTGLGLYFSMLVAKSHTHNGNEGRISVRNGGELGGGVFSIYLP
jgi:K+-sensing histidine kinase KdpD